MQNIALSPDQDYLRTLQIGEVVLSYGQIQHSVPTESEYVQWLAGLPLSMRQHYQAVGYEDGQNLLDFRVYMRKIREQEKIAYMQQHLSTEDFQFWLAYKDTPTDSY